MRGLPDVRLLPLTLSHWLTAVMCDALLISISTNKLFPE